MSIIALPSALRLRHIQWQLDRPAQINVSAYTGARKVVANPWHGKWTAKVEFAQIQGEANILAWRSFFTQLKGRVNTFRLPATETAQNANTGVMVSVSAAAGAKTMTVVGTTAANMIAGQFVTVNGQLLALTDVNVPGAGTNVLTFEPALRLAAPAGTTVVTANPYALVCLSDSAFRWDLSPARMYDFAFEVEEAIGDTETAAPEAFGPASLFGAGDQGFLFDFTDTSKLFQDSAGTTPVTALSDPIGKVTDLSGKGNHATQATSSKRPSYQGYGSFDGVDDELATASINPGSVDKATVVMGVRAAGTGNQGVMGFGTTAGSFYCLFTAAASPPLRGGLTGSTGTSEISIVGDTANTVNKVYTFLFDIAGAAAADEIKIRKNGVLPTQTVQSAGPAGGGNLASNVAKVGSSNGSAFFHQGRIYRIAFIARALSATEYQKLELWCAFGAGVLL